MLLSTATAAAWLLAGCNSMAIEDSQSTDETGEAMEATVESQLAAAPLLDGVYRIVNLNSQLCLDIPPGCDDGSPDACLGAPIIQKPCNGNVHYASTSGNTQAFTFTSQGGASYEIRHFKSGKSLLISGSNTQNGGAAGLHYPTVPVATNRQFVVGALGPGVYGTLTSVSSGLCLNIFGASIMPSAALNQFGAPGTCTGFSQQFRMDQLQP